MDGDEYLPDTETVRGLLSDVRAAIAGAPSPRAACDAIRPRFAALLADPDRLPERYRSTGSRTTPAASGAHAPESGDGRPFRPGSANVAGEPE